MAKELEMTGAPAPWIEPEMARRSCESWRSRLEAEIAGSGQQQKPAKKGKSYLLTILTV